MSTVPMLAPDGTPGDIPQERVHDAIQAGFKLAAELTAPNGRVGLVPVERVHDAINAGFMLKGAPPPSPQPQMHTSYLGVLQGGPTDIPASPQKVPRSIQNAPDWVGDTIGGTAVVGGAATLAAPAVSRAVPVVRQIAARHPVITAMVASEGINAARKIPYVGKLVPPYAEMLPLLLGGPKGKGKATASEAAEGAEAESATQATTSTARPTPSPSATNPPSTSLPTSFPPDLPRYNPAAVPSARPKVFTGFRDTLDDATVQDAMRADLEAHGQASATELGREIRARNTIDTPKSELIQQLRKTTAPIETASAMGAKQVFHLGEGKAAAIFDNENAARAFEATMRRKGVPFTSKAIGQGQVRYDFANSLVRRVLALGKGATQ